MIPKSYPKGKDTPEAITNIYIRSVYYSICNSEKLEIMSNNKE